MFNLRALIPQYRRFWEGVLRLGDLPQRYRRLVDGLDGRSVECVSRLLGRVALLAAWDTRRASIDDVITAAELCELQRQRKELEQQIVPLASDIFAWRHYLLPIREFRASVFLYRHQLHMLDHPERLRDKDVIDAGACLCDSALILREYTKGCIYCFEAMSRHVALMRRTIELNALQDVIVVAKALGAEQGQAEFHYAGGASTMMPGMPAFSGAGAAESVEVITLDSFTEALDCNIGLIKVDIEGAEQLFLAGARRTIERFRPVLLISIYHSPADFFDIKPLIASWDLGYTFKISRPPLVTGVHETLLICEAQP